MPRFSSKRRAHHTAQQMFDLVADVERYPEFVPLCHSLKIRQRAAQPDGTEIMVADMTVSFKLVRESFTSRVTLDRPNLKIMVEYLKGPFSNLENRWTFEPKSETDCDVGFFLSYEFKSRMLAMLMGTMFDTASSALPQRSRSGRMWSMESGRDMTALERVGFIGLGGMGRGLVKNLLDKGVAVTAYDLNPEAVAVAKSQGATEAGRSSRHRRMPHHHDLRQCGRGRRGAADGTRRIARPPGAEFVARRSHHGQSANGRITRSAGACSRRELCRGADDANPEARGRRQGQLVYGGEAELLAGSGPISSAMRRHFSHRPARSRHPPQADPRLPVVANVAAWSRVCAGGEGRPRSQAADHHHLGRRRQERHARPLRPRRSTATLPR